MRYDEISTRPGVNAAAEFKAAHDRIKDQFVSSVYKLVDERAAQICHEQMSNTLMKAKASLELGDAISCDKDIDIQLIEFRAVKTSFNELTERMRATHDDSEFDFEKDCYRAVAYLVAKKIDTMMGRLLPSTGDLDPLRVSTTLYEESVEDSNSALGKIKRLGCTALCGSWLWGQDCFEDNDPSCLLDYTVSSCRPSILQNGAVHQGVKIQFDLQDLSLVAREAFTSQLPERHSDYKKLWSQLDRTSPKLYCASTEL